MRKSDRGKGQKGVGKDRENEKGRKKERECMWLVRVCMRERVCMRKIVWVRMCVCWR